MKDDLLELICLTKLHIYENHSFSNLKQRPIQSPIPIVETPPKALPIKKEFTPSKEPIATVKEVPPTVIVKRDFSDLERIFNKELPHVKLLNEPIDDKVARQEAGKWKTPPEVFAYIITYQESEKELCFLQNVAASISCRHGITMLLNIKDLNEQPQAKLFLVTKTAEKRLEKQFPNMAILDPIQHYFQNPAFKADLWQTINDLAKCL